MQTIQRLKKTLCFHFDSMVSGMENQEAIVQAAIQDVRRALGKLRAQHNRLARQFQDLKKDLGTCVTEQQSWQQRAKETVERDQGLAKQCLAKVMEAENKQSGLEEKMAAKRQGIEQLERQIRMVEKKLSELEERKMALAAKECVAKANQVDERTTHNIDEVFHRWEERIDYLGPAPTESDPSEDDLEKYFCDREQEEELGKRLKALQED